MRTDFMHRRKVWTTTKKKNLKKNPKTMYIYLEVVCHRACLCGTDPTQRLHAISNLFCTYFLIFKITNNLK